MPIRKSANAGEIVTLCDRRAVGRPSLFTDDLAAEICRQIAGGTSLRAVCSQPGMPHRDTVHVWLAADRTFADHYARAREAQADHLAAEVIEITDAPLPDDPQAAYVELGHRKLKADARRWYAGKLAPKKYGTPSDAPRSLPKCSGGGEAVEPENATAEWIRGLLDEASDRPA